MTATCREACCSVTPRFTVAELFERGFRRNRAEPLALEGETITDAEGNSARFSVALNGGRIAELRFRASSCTTLIAYSEALAELLAGFDAVMAVQYAPQDLVAALPGVHPLKQNRAIVAVAAFRSALQTANSRHPEVAADGFALARPEGELRGPSKDDGVTLLGSATSSPRTSR